MSSPVDELDMNALIRLMAQPRGESAEPESPMAPDRPIDDAGYRNPDLEYPLGPPVEPVEDYPLDGGGYRTYPAETSPMKPVPRDVYGSPGGYDNYDEMALIRWEEEVLRRGNEIRETALGTFEVEKGSNTIVSRPPSAYKLD